MSIVVTDTGFAPDDWHLGFTEDAYSASGPHGPALDLPADAQPSDVADVLCDIALIRVDFPSFADGRGFTLARQLRLLGFSGRLRARGPLLPDQYAMARRAGFDEVEISTDHAARDAEQSWLLRADWQAHDYQARLRG